MQQGNLPSLSKTQTSIGGEKFLVKSVLGTKKIMVNKKNITNGLNNMKNKIHLILKCDDKSLKDKKVFAVEFDLTALKKYGEGLRYPDDDFDLVRKEYDLAVAIIADSLFGRLLYKYDTFGKRMLKINKRNESQKKKKERK